MKENGQVVRSVDVGYGNTKFTTGVLSDGLDGICDMFPSLTPSAPQNNFSGALGQARDTVKISLNGETYEVGKEVRLALGGGSHDRVLDENFCLSNRYLALVLAALGYMKVEDVDCLVLGLPLTTYEAKRRHLEEFVSGRHVIDGKTITIHKVTVVPQPMGGFYDFRGSKRHAQRARLREESHHRSGLLHLGLGHIRRQPADRFTLQCSQ